MIITQCVFTVTIHVYWSTIKNAMWNQDDMVLKHKTAYLKLLSLPLSPLPKIQLLKCDISCSLCLLLAHVGDVLFFYRNVHRTGVIIKFIRSMSHRVTCSDLIGLLKSCSVFWALNCVRLNASWSTLIERYVINEVEYLSVVKFKYTIR